MTTLAHDAITVFVREALPNLRSPVGLVIGMIQPLAFLVMFGPLLGGLGDLPGAEAFGAGGSWQWFVPAVLIMLALFGTTGSGYGLLTDLQTGSHERLLVTPLNRVALLVGRTLNDVAMLLAQALLVVVATMPFGFELHPIGALLGLVLIAVLGVGVGALSHALAIACRTHQESFWMVQSTLLFPLIFLSGLMLPLEFGPRWMQVVGAANPLTYVVEALRALVDGRIGDPSVLLGLLSVGAIAVVGVTLGARAISRAEP